MSKPTFSDLLGGNFIELAGGHAARPMYVPATDIVIRDGFGEDVTAITHDIDNEMVLVGNEERSLALDLAKPLPVCVFHLAPITDFVTI